MVGIQGQWGLLCPFSNFRILQGSLSGSLALWVPWRNALTLAVQPTPFAFLVREITVARASLPPGRWIFDIRGPYVCLHVLFKGAGPTTTNVRVFVAAAWLQKRVWG